MFAVIKIAYLIPVVLALTLAAISKFAPLHVPHPYSTAHIEYNLPTEIPSPLTGVYRTNKLLENAIRVFEDKVIGPETVVFDENGAMFLFTENGIYKANRNGDEFAEPELFVQVENGRPLSGVFDSKGNIIFCDAILGLCKADVTDRSYEVLLSHKEVNFCNDVVRASNGDIFLADATAFRVPDRFSIFSSVTAAIGSGSATGRVLKYSPSTGTSSILMTNITLAVGLELSHDERFLLVSDSGRFEVKKLWLKGPKTGSVESFLHSPLPGCPDGISKGLNSTYYIALTVVMNKLIQFSLSSRLARWLSLLVPEHVVLRFVPIHGAVVQVDENGIALRSFHDASGRFGRVSAVTEHNGKLYIASLNNCIKVIDMKEIYTSFNA